MHPNESLIEKFYTSFQNKDHAGMASCYDEEVVFFDPVFQELKGYKAAAMWRMLVERSKDLKITFQTGKADDSRGSAHWEAVYPFSGTGRIVHNRIDAAFEFKNGKIIRHTDSFSLWKWASMALGGTGMFLGWSPTVQNKIRKEAQGGLELFIKRNRLAPK